MTKTEPDFLTPGSTVLGPNNEISEVAARLGSPATLRRGGRVVYYDAFTSLTPWYISVAGATIDTTNAYRGASCLKMTPAGSAPTIQKSFPYIANKTIGVSFNFGFSAVDADTIIKLDSYYLMGGLLQPATIAVYLATGQIKANGTLLTTYTFWKASTPPIMWYNIKFISDCVNRKITRVFINELDIPCSVNNIGSIGAYPIWLISLYVQTVINNTPIYFSDLVLTVDEPI
jgi:hypothetical protein